jgi:tripartite ATP-independent transporter DctM subunit
MTLPELERRGYPPTIAIGSLAGAGTLGLLIPPSIIMIVYGVSTQVSIGKLFIGGIFPGLVLAGMFALYVALWAIFNPALVPPAGERIGLAQKFGSTRKLVPVAALIVLVLGSIYTGIATATEAASVGVLGALALSALQRSLTRRSFIESLISATCLYCMIALILGGAAFLTLAMGYIGLPRALAEWVGALGLPPAQLLGALTLLFILLGCFLDGISMVVLTVSVLVPTLERAGIDLLWFGIYIVLVVEMAQVTPPVGFNLFVLQGMTGRDLGFIARASFPFFVIMVFAVVVLYLFPELATWLPAQMK